MDVCRICNKPAEQLFETGQEGVYACFKCQPLVPEVSLGNENQSDDQAVAPEATDSKELYCALCNKTFERNMQLQNHLRNHRAERRFVCTYCNKAFSQSNNLRAHLRIHTNERPYKCNVCDKAFTQVTNLNNHLRLHTGERPFVCPEPGCDKAYAQVTNLNQHRKRHSPCAPLPCATCGDCFPHRDLLLAHRREAHPSGRSSLSCKICAQSFPTHTQLRQHVAEHMTMAEQDDDDNKFLGATESVRCVFSSCGARLASGRAHTDHLLRAHQIRLRAPHPRRGRPPKSLKIDPLALDPKDDSSYEMQIKQMREQTQHLPKLRVQSLFQ